ncbi:MAG: metallophosphoesterase [Acidimicrobiales bacterium]
MDELPARPERLEDLNFTPQRRMTPWLSPTQLLDTAMRVFLSATFGSYSDKRETEANIADLPPEPYPGPDVWIDYVADMGDAIEPTYAVASLLARPHLDLAVPGQPPHQTDRGRILVMGGDEVYPTASLAAYENQTLGPYRAALPYVVPDEAAPHLFAVPGNHDWYDGLTAFMRTFCQRNWIGGWRTRQTRSYFAVQLPHRWWIWGIDIQFDSYIDAPQFTYFSEVIGPQMKPGDSLILCMPTPSWVSAHEEGGEGAYRTVDYLERKVIRKHKAEVRLAITGDAHHYARYAQTDGDGHKITAGGGGAFLSATHHLPEPLVLPPEGSRDPGKSTPPTHWQLEKCYPSKAESKKLRGRVGRLPLENLGMTAFIGGATLLVAWMAHVQLFGGLDSRPTFGHFFWRLAHNPLALLLAVGLFVGIAGFTGTGDPKKKWTLGPAHAVIQLGAMLLVVWGVARLWSATGLSGFWFAVLYIPSAGAIGGLVGAEILAAYLWVADLPRFKLNANELFAAQRNRDWKNFVRMHIGADGALTVYPVGIDRTPRKFDLAKGGAGNDPWLVLRDPDLECHLIEEPVRIEPIVPPPVPGPAARRRDADPKAASLSAAKAASPRAGPRTARRKAGPAEEVS